MNYWELLGISPTNDLSTVKKAYAQLLKKYHPEDDPEGYQRLREAYDKAIKYIKTTTKHETILNEEDNFSSPSPLHTYKENINKDSNFKPPSPFNLNFENNSKEPDFKPPSPFNTNSENRNKSSLNDEIFAFLDRLNAIYSDINQRIKEENWRDLLSLPIAWNIDAKPKIRRTVFHFLTEHKYLPHNIWLYLNKEFNWEEHKEDLYSIYSKDSVDTILSEVYNCPPLSYNYIIDLKPELLNQYIDLRSMAYKTLYSNNFIAADKYLNSAYKIYTSDLELIKLMGHYYLAIDRYLFALKFFKDALTIKEDDLDCILKIGKISYLTKDYTEAILCFDKILSIKGYDYEILAALAFSYYYSNNLIKSKKLFKELGELYPEYSYTKKVLENINDKLSGYAVNTIKNDGNISKSFKRKRVIYSIAADIPNKKPPTTKNKPSRLKYIVIGIFIFCAIGNYLLWNNSSNYKESTSPIITLEELRSVDSIKAHYVSLKDIQPLDCYVIYEYTLENNIVPTYYREANINQTSPVSNIKNQLYVGKLENKLILFTLGYDFINPPALGDSFTKCSYIESVPSNLLEFVTPQIKILYDDPKLNFITDIYLN